MQLTEKIFHTAPLESKSNLQTGTDWLWCFVISDMLKNLEFQVEISTLGAWTENSYLYTFYEKVVYNKNC